MAQSFDTSTGQRPLPPAEARRVLQTWLSEHPDALIGAVTAAGLPTDIPSGLSLHGVAREERSVLDLVVADDSPTVTEAFIDALARGMSITRVHMASDPEKVVLLQYLDLREEYGILLRLLVASDGEAAGSAEPGLSAADLVANRPRIGFMTKDEVANIVAVDEATTLMLGWAAEDMVGRRSLEFIHPDDHVRAIDNWMARRSNPSARVGTVRLRHLRKDGSWLWIEVSNEFVEAGGVATVHTQVLDISTEMAASEALRRSEGLLRRVTDTVPIGLFHVSGDGEVVFVNPVAQRLLGHTVPSSQAELCALLATGREQELEDALNRVLIEGIEAYLDLEFAPGGSGARASCQVSLRPVVDSDRIAGVLGCIVDVTELKQIADTDALTGLESRRSILQTLAQQLRSRNGRVAAVFVDLDEFKPVNDGFGHGVGDHTLVAVAERLRRGTRPEDHIGRLGGDEFLIVCPGVRLEKDAMEIADRIRAALDRPLAVDGHILKVTASIGVSIATKGTAAEDLVGAADAAMYQAKNVRGGPPVLILPAGASREAG